MKTVVLIILMSVGFGSWSQFQFKAQDSLMGNYSHFSVDNFGRIYLSQNDVILQFSNQYDTLFSTSLKQMSPTSLESSKSFRTLVFDQERSVIHFLDNTLTDIHGEIDLVLMGVQQAVLVCESFAGNTFWVLDEANMRLIKMNENLEVISQTENLITLFEGENLPNQMIESNDFLFVCIPGIGVGVFDVFGTFIRMYPCAPDRIDVSNNYLLIQSGNKVEVVPLESFLDTELVYPLPEGVKEFSFSNDKVYLLKDNGLFIGSFEKQD